MELKDNQSTISIFADPWTLYERRLHQWFPNGEIAPLDIAEQRKTYPRQIISIARQLFCVRDQDSLIQFAGGVSAIDHIRELLRGMQVWRGDIPPIPVACYVVTFDNIIASPSITYRARIQRAMHGGIMQEKIA